AAPIGAAVTATAAATDTACNAGAVALGSVVAAAVIVRLPAELIDELLLKAATVSSTSLVAKAAPIAKVPDVTPAANDTLAATVLAVRVGKSVAIRLTFPLVAVLT